MNQASSESPSRRMALLSIQTAWQASAASREAKGPALGWPSTITSQQAIWPSDLSSAGTALPTRETTSIRDIMTSNPTQALLGSTLGRCLAGQKSVLSIVTMDIANGRSTGAGTDCAPAPGRQEWLRKERSPQGRKALRAQKYIQILVIVTRAGTWKTARLENFGLAAIRSSPRVVSDSLQRNCQHASQRSS